MFQSAKCISLKQKRLWWWWWWWWWWWMEKKCKLQRSVCFDEIIKPIIAWKDFLLSSLSVSLLIGNWDTITLLLNCCERYSLIIIIMIMTMMMTMMMITMKMTICDIREATQLSRFPFQILCDARNVNTWINIIIVIINVIIIIVIIIFNYMCVHTWWLA